jgi:hypothetical protein
MRVLRSAAVLILLGLSLGTSGAAAAKARPEIPSRSSTATRSAPGLFAPLWRRVTGAWAKEGCAIEPWGRCGISNLGGTPTQDAGCTINPWGSCSPGH